MNSNLIYLKKKKKKLNLLLISYKERLKKITYLACSRQPCKVVPLYCVSSFSRDNSNDISA